MDSLAQKAWADLHRINPGFHKVHERIDYLIDLFDIVERETPFHKSGYRTLEYSDSEKIVIRQWFMTVIEGKDYECDIGYMFDCFIERLQIKRNIKLLKEYKDKIYSKLRIHQKLDEEINILANRSDSNLEIIESFIDNDE